MKVPSIARLVFNRNFFQKIFAIILLIVIADFLKQFVFLFMVTFIFAYLFLSLGEFLHEKLSAFITKKIQSKGPKRFFEFIFSTNVLVLFLYLLFVGLLVYAISDLVPKALQELTQLGNSIPGLSEQISLIQGRLEELKNFKQDFNGTIENIFKSQNNIDMIWKFIGNIKSAGLIMIEFLIAMILSYVFIVDRHKIQAYLKEVQKGNFAFLYNEYAIILTKISNGFGLIFKAQSFISLINTILTVIGLYAIAWIHGSSTFPFIFTLAIVVFIFGMIPVLGMFLSGIPLIMIGFSFGQVPVVVEIILMVVVIHMIEAYYLNPRIVSSYAELPMSLTLLILVISEQIFGPAGLLIGVPIFYIVVDIMKDFDVYIGKVKKAYEGINYLKNETQSNLAKDIRLSRSGKKGT